LKTRQPGQPKFIQLHLEMRGTAPFLEAHKISGDVEHKILEAFPDSGVIIHQDPEGAEEDYPKYH